jgi:prolyl-tRNA synthetase
LWGRVDLREAFAAAGPSKSSDFRIETFIRQLSAGLYNYLFLAQRSLLKIQRIVSEEMGAIGAQEMYLPALNPAEIWQESGRWDIMGENMFQLKERFGRASSS